MVSAQELPAEPRVRALAGLVKRAQHDAAQRWPDDREVLVAEDILTAGYVPPDEYQAVLDELERVRAQRDALGRQVASVRSLCERQREDWAPGGGLLHIDQVEAALDEEVERQAL
jgi:hypothetical protein